MHQIRIDRSKKLRDEPHLGHNRYHPDIEPILEVAPGETVLIETRDGLDGQIRPGATEAALAALDGGLIHPLTGPIYVKGAAPGDALEIEFLEIETQPHGFSAVVPGLGFLRDLIDTPLLVHWDIEGGFATSKQLPGIRLPGAPFMGISVVAPSEEAFAEWRDREQRLLDRGGFVLPPDESGAVPLAAMHGLRTLPPRENGGNFDVKQLTRGAKLLLPVYVDGALYSTGDGHFAQGDGEVSVTAVEVGATVTVRFAVHEGLAAKRRFRAPVFSHPGYFADPAVAVPQRFLGVMGMPIDASGENRGEDLTLAARNAVINMIELVQERGYTREQAYVICSVAMDLRVSNVVDAPNYVVSALLPEMIFER
jgi:formamidase